MAEVLHSSRLTQKRTWLSIYEACIDILEQITVKQNAEGV